MMRFLHIFLLVPLLGTTTTTLAFTTPSSSRAHATTTTTRTTTTASLSLSSTDRLPKIVTTALVGAILSVAPFHNNLPAALAYDPSDYASETVTAAVQSLQQAKGNTQATYSAYESIASIITEGKGVGGNVNYQGIQLERGYIADEDTAIYNPGLTLLTESEKERLVEAIITSRQAGQGQNQWSDDNQVAYEFLKEKLDPLHMTELRGYLKFVPIYGAVLYLGVLAIQQLARDFFPVAYLVAAAAIFLPAIALVALGPQ